jgi:hypothetical protein
MVCILKYTQHKGLCVHSHVQMTPPPPPSSPSATILHWLGTRKEKGPHYFVCIVLQWIGKSSEGHFHHHKPNKESNLKKKIILLAASHCSISYITVVWNVFSFLSFMSVFARKFKTLLILHTTYHINISYLGFVFPICNKLTVWRTEQITVIGIQLDIVLIQWSGKSVFIKDMVEAGYIT